MQGDTFFGAFDFEAAPDPTHGYIDYVNQSECEKAGIINVTAKQVRMAVDNRKVQQEPRKSVRLASKATYNSGLFVIDVEHLPTGCATWPAFWLVGPAWPTHGEIDIIEGVNVNTEVVSTLHTNSGCSQSGVNNSQFTGHYGNNNAGGRADDCDVKAPKQGNNQGCGINGLAESYGTPFNNAKGGVYATEWTGDMIRVFFWPRASAPANVFTDHPDPDTWGKPMAYFALGGNCPATHFSDMKIIFDLVLCGDWAGNSYVFGHDCPGLGSCQDFVSNHPEKLDEAYWLVNSVKTFQKS